MPGETFVMSTAEGPFPMETIYTWRDSPSGATTTKLVPPPRPSYQLMSCSQGCQQLFRHVVATEPKGTPEQDWTATSGWDDQARASWETNRQQARGRRVTLRNR
jgi:hypothetical protein